MKTMIGFVAFVALVIGAMVYDGTKTTCGFEYDTSFNGLYLLKDKVCRGRSGMEYSRKTVARKPLFTEF
jgi:hypothetical protein